MPSGAVRLAVPYAEKDRFKQKYGRQFFWNPQDKSWYWCSEAALPDDLRPFLPASTVAAAQNQPATSEPRLTLELIPKTCWASSVRKQMSKEQWDTIRKAIFSTAHYQCEICGGRGEAWPVECHEVYQYDEAARMQTLLGFAALCPSCRLVKQYGRAQCEGREREALAQLRKVNGWPENEARKYVDEQFEVWERRSRIKWAIDLSYLERRFGIAIKPESTDQRHDRATAYYQEKLAEYLERHPEEDLWTEMTTDDGFRDTRPAPTPPPLPPPIPSQPPSLLKRIGGLLLPKRKS